MRAKVAALEEALDGTGRTGAGYRQLAKRRGKSKAQWPWAARSLPSRTLCCPTPRPSATTSVPTTTRNVRTAAAQSTTTYEPCNGSATR